ncbi:uncharacterized protein LOC132724289 [Ruditapes philippinarum]|uniref:uncharacterized protein LOC132724289 n=1 Tax=Ruditapes philippinarum TaxID=129788 RepID=UPI00295BA105|nr:uncharacterized protein LOC132724289 [Ruditapes philippinarum]XP_060565106.1 uncharacterized protein LOC132724289 [Ruditapes philippinarum]XP_060565107.1 uncharacterized protein LOC132724289 [Ruditapes philippinarum]XP_060565110.1 uncharacterized protein LOC132724289 [Ruditapes philippinarum]
MMLTRQKSYSCIIILIMFSLNIADGLRCKWSNENCDSDSQCCSSRCVKLHEGTNPRCASSPMHYPCFFSYQCEDGLTCGDYYTCCAPFWGVCTDKDDCCDPQYVCREEDGFIYNRCLSPNGAPYLPGSSMLMLTIQAYFVLNVWYKLHLQS